jgi:hypothetical protein
MKMTAIEYAVKLWTDLDHPESFSEARYMSDSLTRIFFGMTDDERAEYKERIWKIVQKKLRKQKAKLIRSMLPEVFRRHTNGEYLRANRVFDTIIKIVS